MQLCHNCGHWAPEERATRAWPKRMRQISVPGHRWCSCCGQVAPFTRAVPTPSSTSHHHPSGGGGTYRVQVRLKLKAITQKMGPRTHRGRHGERPTVSKGCSELKLPLGLCVPQPCLAARGPAHTPSFRSGPPSLGRGRANSVRAPAPERQTALRPLSAPGPRARMPPPSPHSLEYCDCTCATASPGLVQR